MPAIRFLAASLFALTASVALAATAPVAPVEPVNNTYFGTTITDPYRWMETTDDPRFAAFMKSEDDYTRSVLNAIPGRDALARRIESLSNAGTVVYQVTTAGEMIFYFKVSPTDQTPKLFVRRGLHGAERLLADANAMGNAEVHYTIDWLAPSNSGRLLAYGVSKGGSEESTLHIVDAVTGKQLGESIEGARFGVSAWLLGDHALLYPRLRPPAAGAPPSAKYQKLKLYEHRIGTNLDGEGDAAVFGYGVSPDVAVDDTELSTINYSPHSDYLIGVVRRFVKNEFDLYATPLKGFSGASSHWVRLVSEADDVTDFDVHGKDVYLLTHKDASRFKIVKMSMADPDFAHATEVVPTGQAVIKHIAAAKDALYIQELEGGLGKALRLPFAAGASATPVPLPFAGSIGEMSVDATRPGFLVKLTSWTEPQLWYAFDPKANTVTDTGLRIRSPVDFSQITSEEVMAKAADGTMIPLSIVYRKDLKRDGSNPTILEGYGSYGVTLDSGFNPPLLAWLERGGIFATAHVRGGGEFGEDWHTAGQKLNKGNTITDFIACAQYLIQQGYTSPAKLAGQGGSAGGITVGGAATQRPDLFAVIIDNVGVSDTLRVELSPNGPTNIPEFGTVTSEDGFKGLYLMSAYAHVTDGTMFPAMLLTTGINDPRVAPWQMGKMAARLQAASASKKPILLRVDYDAGHGIGSTKAQGAQESADEWAFILWQTGDPQFQPAKP